jgi:Raf kinase inhibitor-like YbhB/YbcL family protein
MRRTVSIGLAVMAVPLTGCGDDKVSGPPPAAPERIVLSSAAFTPGGTIPKAFTCSGEGESPPLRWRGVPRGARSLALLVEDPDAPGGTFVHWTAWDIPPATKALAAGAKPPRQGHSSGGDTGWQPPCPPEGKEPHRYTFTLYALRAPLDVDEGAKPDAVRGAIGKQALARGSLTGRFGRGQTP